MGMGKAQANDFSATLTQGDFTKNVNFLPTSPELRPGREPLAMYGAELRQCELGELCWVVTVLDRTAVRGWRKLHHVSAPPVGVTYTALMSRRER